MENVELQTPDGARIAARLFRPDSQVATARAAVLIGPAMGVRQEFYRPFARWLAEQGYLVATFDYRGMGDSRPRELARSLKGFEADLFDWACDYDTAIEALRAAAPGLPLYLLGHSLGAQLPGLLRNRGRVDGLVSVAAGSGYWRDNAPRTRRTVLYFWHVLVPLATRLYGYFPGRRLRKVGDLPRGVILQWRRWCLHPGYHVGAEGHHVQQAFAEARFPVVAFSMSDDELMTERGTHALVDCYRNAPRRIERITPQDANVGRIGHFGFFREQFEATLWRRASELFHGFQSFNQEMT
ncbi:alpha/beta fold hydrolase [Aquabacterium sp. A7-Y]|uniref:alpha/beta hydrolase family protein n=1 Tax=Aquabacterium sp. A7-Y TaxID=1349605 RepID=UPI00223D6461|nr:alpha/beta fold hydrolase [Aquabacterium sp. A7-Y]MCW7537104.1 alpha/beta fold hydrolase [Aquabacterium sp. A7-Y]